MLEIKIGDYVHTKVNKALVADIILKQLTNKKIKGTIRKTAEGMEVLPDKDGKLFISAVDNKSARKVQPEEAIKLGRNYYKTTRLRKDQFEIVIGILLGTFDDLKLPADITYKGTVWRKGLVNYRENIKTPMRFAEKL